MTGVTEFPIDGYEYSADDVGRALAGLIRRNPDGSPREGMLAVGPDLLAVPASWKVQVGVFSHVRAVSGAIRVGGLSAAEQVDITPATGIPAGQARIDLIVWDPDDVLLAVIDGTPAATPTVPADGGLIPVATVRVNAGDGLVIQGQVSAVYEVTSLATGQSGISRGVVSARAVNAGAALEVPVTFAPGTYDAPPAVVASTTGGIRDVNASVKEVTKDGFKLVLGSMSTVKRTFGATWIAAS